MPLTIDQLTPPERHFYKAIFDSSLLIPISNFSRLEDKMAEIFYEHKFSNGESYTGLPLFVKLEIIKKMDIRSDFKYFFSDKKLKLAAFVADRLFSWCTFVIGLNEDEKEKIIDAHTKLMVLRLQAIYVTKDYGAYRDEYWEFIHERLKEAVLFGYKDELLIKRLENDYLTDFYVEKGLLNKPLTQDFSNPAQMLESSLHHVQVFYHEAANGRLGLSKEFVNTCKQKNFAALLHIQREIDRQYKLQIHPIPWERRLASNRVIFIMMVLIFIVAYFPNVYILLGLLCAVAILIYDVRRKSYEISPKVVENIYKQYTHLRRGQRDMPSIQLAYKILDYIRQPPALHLIKFEDANKQLHQVYSLNEVKDNKPDPATIYHYTQRQEQYNQRRYYPRLAQLPPSAAAPPVEIVESKATAATWQIVNRELNNSGILVTDERSKSKGYFCFSPHYTLENFANGVFVSYPHYARFIAQEGEFNGFKYIAGKQLYEFKTASEWRYIFKLTEKKIIITNNSEQISIPMYEFIKEGRKNDPNLYHI